VYEKARERKRQAHNYKGGFSRGLGKNKLNRRDCWSERYRPSPPSLSFSSGKKKKKMIKRKSEGNLNLNLNQTWLKQLSVLGRS